MEKDSKKKSIILSIIILIVLVATTISFAYAYFTAEVNNGSDVKVKTATAIDNDTFITSGVSLTVDVTNDLMQKKYSSNDYSKNIEKSGTLSVSLQAGSGTAICTYDLAITDSGKDTYVKSTELGDLLEYTVQGTDGTQIFAEINIDNALSSTKTPSGSSTEKNGTDGSVQGTTQTTGILGSYQISDNYDESGEQQPTVQNWDIKSIFYNLNKNQDSQADKSFTYDIKVVNVDCKNVGETYLVKYVANDSVIYQEYVSEGRSVENVPDVPAYSNYNGEWSSDGTNITKDTTITAKYYYLVTFINESDSITSLSTSEYKIYKGEESTLDFTDTEVSVGGKVIVTATLIDTNYIIDGWALNSDVAYIYNNDEYGNNSYEVTEDVEFMYNTDYDGCVLKGSKISMADGTTKNIEDIKPGDSVLAYDYYTGTISAKKVYYVIPGKSVAKVFTVTLENGNVLQIADTETLFNTDTKKFMPINADTYKDAIGQSVMVNNNGEIGTSKIKSISVEIKDVEHYTMYTSGTVDYIANNIVALAPTYYNNVRYVIGDDYKIDMDKYNADVSKYGVYTYDDLKDVCTKETFDSFTLKDFKAMVEKGYLTFEEFKEGIKLLQEEVDLYLK